MADSFLSAILGQTLRGWFRDPRLGEQFALRAAAPVVDLAMRGLYAAMEGIEGEPREVLREVFAVSPDASDAEAARQIAGSIKHVIPANLRNIGAAVANEPPRPPQHPPPPADPATPAGPAAAAAAQSEDLRILAERAAQVAQTYPERWTYDFLLNEFEFWRARLDVIEERCESPEGKDAIAAARARMAWEQLHVPVRQGIALTLREGARAAGFRSATTSMGSKVHRTLQCRYIMTRWYATVVSEWWVYLPNERPVTISEHTRRVLRESGGWNVTYLVAEQSRLSPFRREDTKYLLWDLLDMSLGEIWEIKAIGSAHEAVVQETYYRLSYEVMAAHWLCHGFQVAPGRLDPGADFPLVDPYSGELLVDVGSGLAFPFTYSRLPGLVLYVVLGRRQRSLEKVLAAIKLMMEMVEKALTALLAIARKLFVILVVAAVVVAILLVIVIILLLASRQPEPGRPAPGLPSPGGGDVVPVPAPAPGDRVPAGLRFLGAGADGLTFSMTGEDREANGGELRIGNVRVAGITPEEVAELMPRLGAALTRALGAMGAAGGGEVPRV